MFFIENKDLTDALGLFYCPEQNVKRLKTLASKKEKATTLSGKTYVLTKTKDYVKPSLAYDYKKAVSDFRGEGAKRIQEVVDKYSKC